ncbi:hypothetical protein JA1_000916 [Spathaspora sp. JA1]|nr:hypothetical protein JA1_000916 [Spathaspora sp. JA1]
MSLETLLVEKQQELTNINQSLEQTCLLVTTTNLTQDSKLKQLFYREHQPQLQQTPLVSLDQLNKKHETVQSKIRQLQQLVQLNRVLSEIKELLNKPKEISDLLDLQQLSNLFKSTTIPTSTLLIYGQLQQSFDKLRFQFIQQLNDYLVLLIPDPYHIEHVAYLQDYNSFLSKNGYSLEVYSQYRKHWDELIDVILTKTVEFNQDDLQVSIKLVDSSDPNWLKSAIRFIQFINELSNIPIKQYLNSKLSKVLILKISTNINQLNMSGLLELVQVCKETGWNIPRLSSGSIEENLSKLHKDWIIDEFINKIRQVYLGEDFKDLQLVENIDAIEQNKQGTVVQVEEEAVKKEEETIEEEETDGWNDNWDDGWDDEDQSEPEEQQQNEEDDWNDKWDDNWDNDDEEEEQQQPTQIKTQKKQEIEKTQEPVKVQNSSQMFISQIPNKLIEIFQDFQLDSKYLIMSIKALSVNVYPSLTESFLMYNDLIYLHHTLGLPQLLSFIRINYQQALSNYYLEINQILSLIDLTEEETADNNNSLDLLDKWFKNLDNQLKITNPDKFNQFITDITDYIYTWLINSIIGLQDISEFQGVKITDIIDTINDIINIKTRASYNKLNNVRFLLNNHLSATLDRFYQGDLYDLTTEEIIHLITSVFAPSDLRSSTINEINEFRTLN